jgi:Glycosyltransferase family 87
MLSSTPIRTGLLADFPRLRSFALVILGLGGLIFYQQIRLAGGAVVVSGNAYLWPGLGVALVAILAAWLELGRGAAKAGSPLSRRHIWEEVALIFAVGITFRAVFLFVPPTISHDAYRYIWDAHLVSHGVSPYLYPASDPALIWLRDHAIWPKVDWQSAPTIYPPGAELIFWLVSTIAPLNITAMQLAMVACDLGTGVITLLLLLHYRLDPRRVIVYWWNPIPILEFVYSAHVDAAATLCVALALLLALGRWRGAGFLAGVALAMAVLIKLYPLLFVVALLRRRDWGFLAGLCLTLVLVPLPFLHLGLANGGFLTTYFSQRFVDQGIIFRLITQLIVNRRWQFALQASVLALLTGAVFYLRVRQRLRAAAGILALSAAWIVVSPHLFPWYVGGLLPFLALYLRLPSPAARWVAPEPSGDLAGETPELPLALWLFVLAMPFTYVIFTPRYNANLFLLFFAVSAAVAGVSLYRKCWSRFGRRLLHGRYAAHALSSTSAGGSIPPAAKE